jgi:hypothetical protein
MAVPDRVLEFQVATLKRAGVTGWRTAHNPVAPELLDFADQYGMLVMSENRFVQAGVQPVASPKRGGPQTAGAAGFESRDHFGDVPSADPTLLANAVDMVVRDRNHPSIVIWSLCNELGCASDSPTGDSLAAQFKTAILGADKSRPITSNTVQRPYLQNHDVDAFAQAMDVQSFSYEYDAYTSYHQAAPWKPVGGGEAGSCITDRGYFAADANGHVGPSSRDLFGCLQEGWKHAAILPFVYGNFLWTGFDYAGETYPTGWPARSSHFGNWDNCGFPKQGVGFLHSWWRDFPAGCSGENVHAFISPDDWTAPVAVGSPVDVVVTTCAASVSLFVNGEPANPASLPVSMFGFAKWPAVTFTPGKLTAVAYSEGGAVVATQTVLTAGAPFALRAWVEDVYQPPRNGSQIAADGQDVALIGVEIVDANGVRVPNADVVVTFQVLGPAAVVGVTNGDPADHTPSKAETKVTWKGLARAFVASSAPNRTGDVVVTAAAPGLQPGNVRLVAS